MDDVLFWIGVVVLVISGLSHVDRREEDIGRSTVAFPVLFFLAAAVAHHIGY